MEKDNKNYKCYQNGVRVDTCPYYIPYDRCAISTDKCDEDPNCYYKTNCINNDTKGIKYDSGKPRIGEMIEDFGPELLEVCKVWEFGANKYGKSNWKEVENGKCRYTNAMQRHYLKEKEEGLDKETKLHHAIHVAWNALARLHFILEETDNG